MSKFATLPHAISKTKTQSNDQRPKNIPNGPGQRLLVAGNPKGDVFAFLRVDLMDVLRNGSQLRFRLCHSTIRFQPCNDRKEVAPTVFLHLRGWLNRQPQSFVQVLSHHFRKTKARRHHTDDRPRFAVDTDCLARDFAVGIECLPP